MFWWKYRFKPTFEGFLAVAAAFALPFFMNAAAPEFQDESLSGKIAMLSLIYMLILFPLIFKLNTEKTVEHFEIDYGYNSFVKGADRYIEDLHYFVYHDTGDHQLFIDKDQAFQALAELLEKKGGTANHIKCMRTKGAMIYKRGNSYLVSPGLFKKIRCNTPEKAIIKCREAWDE